MIDFDKFTKYSKAGPRYTSYPTAVEFNSSFDEQKYISYLKDVKRDVSLYFHLPFCRSACYFCGCNVVFTSRDEKKERYIDYLQKEIEIISKYLDTNKPVSQLHFGGGTPTFFDAHQLKIVIELIKFKFTNFKPDAEISCEIDPRFFDEEQLKVLIDGGFNRFSFGVQDFDIEVQREIHRVQSFELTQSAVNMSRNYGIGSINIDLIYGLPLQSLDKFKKTLEQILIINPNRLAIFNYAHVPWLKKTMRKIDETKLPTPSEKLQILKYTIDFLTSNGYKMIGMDHFAKEDDELFLAIEKGELNRNFQGYTTKKSIDLIGIGLTSISEGEMFYAQNFKDMNLYEEAIDRGSLPIERGIALTQDDFICKYVIMELMANFKIDIARFNEKFNLDFFEYFDLSGLDEFIEDNLVELDKDRLSVNTTGTLLIRNIAMVFDRYLQNSDSSKKVFSKTV